MVISFVYHIKALFRFKVQNSKRFVNRLHGVLNVVKKSHYTNGL